MSEISLRIIQVLSADLQDELQALGNFPKVKKFEHGCQIGRYQGLQTAIARVKQILDDEDIREI